MISETLDIAGRHRVVRKDKVLPAMSFSGTILVVVIGLFLCFSVSCSRQEAVDPVIEEKTRTLIELIREMGIDAPTAKKVVVRHGKPMVKCLVSVLHDPKENTKDRAAAAILLGGLQEEGRPIVSELVKGLGDNSELVRRASVHALSALGEVAGKAAPDLVRLMEKEEGSLKLAVAMALINVGHKDAIPANEVKKMAELRNIEGLVDEAVSAPIRGIRKQSSPD